jgi:hypothetical protein
MGIKGSEVDPKIKLNWRIKKLLDPKGVFPDLDL